MSMRTIRQYSEAFKLQVVAELESGKLRTMDEARERYGIPGQGTVSNWVRKYGKPCQQTRIVRVETPNEKDELRRLKKENERLKKALADSHMKAVFMESLFEVTCENFGVQDIEAYKKKLEKRQ